MLFTSVQCQMCQDIFSDSKLDYRFSVPICLGCGKKLMPYDDLEDQDEKESN
jgi:hypothetical protein